MTLSPSCLVSWDLSSWSGELLVARWGHAMCLTAQRLDCRAYCRDGPHGPLGSTFGKRSGWWPSLWVSLASPPTAVGSTTARRLHPPGKAFSEVGWMGSGSAGQERLSAEVLLLPQRACVAFILFYYFKKLWNVSSYMWKMHIMAICILKMLLFSSWIWLVSHILILPNHFSFWQWKENMAIVKNVGEILKTKRKK